LQRSFANFEIVLIGCIPPYYAAPWESVTRMAAQRRVVHNDMAVERSPSAVPLRAVPDTWDRMNQSRSRGLAKLDPAMI
jgi:hypothetical protein